MTDAEKLIYAEKVIEEARLQGRYKDPYHNYWPDFWRALAEYDRVCSQVENGPS